MQTFRTQLFSAYLEDENVVGMAQYAEGSFDQSVDTGTSRIFPIAFRFALAKGKREPSRGRNTKPWRKVFHTKTLLPYLEVGAGSCLMQGLRR